MLVQGVAVAVALLAAMLFPPEEGPMLVIPLSGAGTGETMAWTLGKETAFLGAGPLPGSVLVYGRRENVTNGAWHHHSLVIKAPAIFCGNLASNYRNI